LPVKELGYVSAGFAWLAGPLATGNRRGLTRRKLCWYRASMTLSLNKPKLDNLAADIWTTSPPAIAAG